MNAWQHEKKAQSALEYLMTYGWGIVVIAVVVAGLTLLTNPSVLAKGSASGFSKNLVVVNASYPSRTDGTIQLIVSNTAGRNLTLTGITITQNGAAVAGVPTMDGFQFPDVPAVLKPAAKKTLVFYPYNDWPQGNSNITVVLTATDSDGFPKNSSGSLTFAAPSCTDLCKPASGYACYSNTSQHSCVTNSDSDPCYEYSTSTGLGCTTCNFATDYCDSQ